LKRLIICGLVLVHGTVIAGPLFDPFLERFQVGTYGDPEQIVLTEGFPADLLVPAALDEAWVAAAREVLQAGGRDPQPYLTHDLIPSSANGWWQEMNLAVDQLESRDFSAEFPGATGILRADRASRAVFAHAEAGRYSQAAALSVQLRDGGAAWGLSPRAIFVWDLRAILFARLARNTTGGPWTSWPSMLDLGPYDTGNAWTIWVAYCRDRGISPLPPVMTSETWGRHLAGMGRFWLTPTDLYESDMPLEFQSGLGAVMFKGAQRDAHFEKFPDPPQDNELQGLWIRGRRLQSGGDPAVYEEMAQRSDINPGWRLDLWRRASELHLLKGDWNAGQADLEQALKLAAAQEGHWTTRRRLRQWNEQAIVLALAMDDLARARLFRALGLEYFQGKEKAAFQRETDHWNDRLEEVDDPAFIPSANLTEQAEWVVATGEVTDLEPRDPARLEEFLAASAQSLWPLWIKWGLNLANPEPVEGVVRERAIAYGQALTAMSEETDALAQRKAALNLISARLGDRPAFTAILKQAFDRDVCLASGWEIAPDPSLVPVILPSLRGSELDRHALLGFALAAGDMRGILAVAVELEGRGLTLEEKRRFLYPLPSEGAIFEALITAESDPALLLAVARNESLFEPSVRSRAGALGWMQIMPFHYEDRGALPGSGNWRNPGISIGKGDRLLAENRRRYDGNPYQAVAAYNAGPRAASRWEAQLGGNPDRAIYLAWIGYPETRHYVEKVLIDREIYDWIIRPESGALPLGTDNPSSGTE